MGLAYTDENGTLVTAALKGGTGELVPQGEGVALVLTGTRHDPRVGHELAAEHVAAGRHDQSGPIVLADGADMSAFTDFTNSGRITLGQGNATDVSFHQDFTQTASRVLNLDIGGTGAGWEHDQFSVGGTATLGGTLSVTLLDGFTPALGDEFSSRSSLSAAVRSRRSTRRASAAADRSILATTPTR